MSRRPDDDPPDLSRRRRARVPRAGITGREIAEGIAKSLAKSTVAMALDGALADLADPIDARRQDRVRHPATTRARSN